MPVVVIWNGTCAISQAAQGDYLAASKDFSFKLKGMGAGTIPGPGDEVAGTRVTFQESATAPLNPERGIYCAHEVHSDKTTLSAGDVKARRATGRSLWLLEFYLAQLFYLHIGNKARLCMQNTNAHQR